MPPASRSNCMKTRFQSLDIPPAVAAEFAIGVALVGRHQAHVVVDLAAGAARTGVAHLPEIVFEAKLKNAIFRDALAQPQVVSLGIALTCRLRR